MNKPVTIDVRAEKVLLQLEALESRRPLESIRDDAERERVRETREWFKREFLQP